MGMSEKDRSDSLWMRVALQVKDSSGDVKKTVRWHIKEVPVCKNMWCHANMCGHDSIDKMKKLMADGHDSMPAMLPKVPGTKSCERKFMIDAWFLKLYQSLGEPLAVPDTSLHEDEESNLLLQEPDHPLWSLGVKVDAKYRAVPKRWLNPGSPESLWVQYKLDDSCQDKAQWGRCPSTSSIWS